MCGFHPLRNEGYSLRSFFGTNLSRYDPKLTRTEPFNNALLNILAKLYNKTVDRHVKFI